MSEISHDPSHEEPGPEAPLGDPGEHPLSILLFSWMRGTLFLRIFAGLLGVIGLAAVGLEIALAKPIKDATSFPGFYALFGLIAFIVVVLCGWPLGKMLRRPEGYYDTRSGEAGRDR